MIAAALALLLCAPASALFGREPKTAVLWSPAAGFSAWAQLESALGRYDDVRLTLALTPSQLTPEARKFLEPWLAKKRVELALRLEGDPILPMIASQPPFPRPADVRDRIAVERDVFRVAAGTAAAGFVPGAGALDLTTLAPLRDMGLSWVAAGDYAGSTASWTSEGEMLLVPCRGLQTLGAELTADMLKPPSATAPVVFAVDEADGLVPPGSMARLFAAMDAQKPSGGWGTVSEVAAAARAGARRASSLRALPAWTGSLSPWNSSERSRRNWSLYSTAAGAVDKFQNSGAADLGMLEAATEELWAAQANRFFRALTGPEAEAADRALRARLIAVYRKMKQTPPDTLFNAPASGAAAARADEQPSAVRVTEGQDWIEFENPAGSLSRPAAGLILEYGSPPHALFKIESMRVASSEAALAFTFRMGLLDAAAHPDPAPAAAPEMGRVLVDVYIDVNNVPNAGSGTLLFDKTAFIQSRDAWEYALTISAWGAFLYRSTPLGAPIQVSRVGVSADPASREIRVAVPRSLLRGNPLRWGFVVSASAADVSTAAKPPVKPALQPKGPTALGLLAPLEQQEALAKSAEHSRPRLSALRAK